MQVGASTHPRPGSGGVGWVYCANTLLLLSVQNWGTGRSEPRASVGTSGVTHIKKQLTVFFRASCVNYHGGNDKVSELRGCKEEPQTSFGGEMWDKGAPWSGERPGPCGQAPCILPTGCLPAPAKVSMSSACFAKLCLAWLSRARSSFVWL